MFTSDTDWAAPAIIKQEFYNLVRRLEARHIFDADEADGAVQRFADLRLITFDEPDWIERALATSREYNQSGIFDAIYLACADDLGAELWTYDGAFVRSFGDRRPANLRFAPEDARAYLGRSP